MLRTNLIYLKRQSNILASIIKNFDTVEKVIETSQNSAGSALKENEVYLDSIQGKLDQLSNSTQTMWMNFMRSDVVKFLISVATEIVKITDKVGLLNVVISAFLAKIAFTSKNGFGRWSQMLFPSLDKYIVQAQAAAAKNQTLGVSATMAAGGVKLLNAALTMGAALLAGLAISLVIKGLDKLIVTTKELRESAQEAIDTYTSAQSELSSIKTNLDDLSDEYAKLSVGVDEFGNNISLSTSQYKRYNEIINQIADMFPQMVRGYTNEGNAIIKNKGNVEALTEAYKALRKEANDAVISKADDIMKSYQRTFQSAWYENGPDTDAVKIKASKELKNILNNQDTYDWNNAIFADANNSGVRDTIVKLLEDAGIEKKSWFETSKDYVQRAISEYPGIVQSIVNAWDSTVNTAVSNVKPLIQAYIDNSVGYTDVGLTDQQRSVIDSVVNSIDEEFLNAFDGDASKLQLAIEQIITDIKTSGIDDEYVSILNAQTIFNRDEISIGEYKKQVDDFLAELDRLQTAGLLNETDVKYIKLSLGFDGESIDEQVDQMLAYAENVIDTSKETIESELQRLSKGGTVDLLLRPKVEASIVNDHGWDVEEGDIATVLSSTFSNEDGTIAMNFTPIIVDENGQYKGMLSPDELQAYGEEVIAGVREDDLNLKIGATYEGSDAIAQAERDANIIHELHQMYFLDGGEDLTGELTYSDLQIINSDQFNVDGSTIATWEQLRYEINLVKTAMTQDFTTADFGDYSESIKTISTNIATYQEALDKLESGTFTLTDFMELIDQFPDLAKGVDASSKSFNGLSKNLRNAIRNSPKALVGDLKKLRAELEAAGKSTENIDQLISAIEDMPEDTVKNLANEYGTLADEINAARIAQNKLKEAMQENPNEGYETRGEALEQMKTLMEKGQIGSGSELWSIAEAYGFTYDSAKTIAENADALYKYIQVRERWFKKDKEGNYTDEGITNFIKDVAGKKDILEQFGATWTFNNGKLNIDLDNESWEEFAAAIGLTSEEFADMMEQISMFFEIEWSDVDDVVAWITKVSESSGTAADKLAKITSTTESYVEDVLGQDLDLSNLSLEDLGKIEMPEGMDTEEFSKVISLLETYIQLRDKLSDPLNLNKTLEEKGLEGLSEVPELQNTIQQNSDGTTIVDEAAFKTVLEDAGYTEEAIDSLIQKIKEYQELVGQSPTSNPPAGASTTPNGGNTTDSNTPTTEETGKVETGANNGIAAALIAGGATIGATILGKVMDGAGDVADAATGVVSDIVDKTTDAIGDALNGDDKVKLDIPNDGVPLDIPSNGIPVDVPENGIKLDVPDEGVPINIPDEGVPINIPDEGIPLDMPDDGLALNTPDDGIELNIPQDGVPLDIPSDGIELNTPENGMPLDVPDDGLPIDVPDDGIELNTPENGIPLDIPTDGVPLSIPENGISLNIPENGIPLDVPEDGLKVHIDNDPNESNDTDENPNFGERIQTSIQDTADSIVDSGVGIVEDAGKIVSDVADAAEDAVNWVADQVHSLLNPNPDREGGGGSTRCGGAGRDGGRPVDETEAPSIAPSKKEGVVKYSVDDSDVVAWEAPDKNANVIYTPNSDNLDTYEAVNKDASVVLSIDDTNVTTYTPENKTGTVEYNAQMNDWEPPIKYGTVIYSASGEGENPAGANGNANLQFGGGSSRGGGGGGNRDFINGTAHVNGTAYQSGKWGAQKTETALVGELGPELRVRGNQWSLIGENGAEFTDVRKGDIIFNHKQTESLLANGYVNGRGKAHAEGTAFLTGSGSIKKYKFSDTDSSGKLSKAADDLSKAADELSDDFEEIFDWIEVRIEEITETISLMSAKLENAIGSISQNAVIDDMISMNKQLYDNLIAGANEYYAFSAKLLEKVPAQYREMAQDGTIAIESFTGTVGEEALTAIQDYREWVQKGADMTQQAEETLTEISNLAKQAIDNIASDYENKKSFSTAKIDQYEAYNSLLETSVGAESAKIYEQMIRENNKNIAVLQEQRGKMQAELNKQVEAGNIKKYSQNWYDAINDIAAVDTEIINLTTDTKDYQDTINELHWEHFDNLLSRIEAISNEANNLIDVLGAKDLVDKDTAEWTDEGITSLGLYAQQLEVTEMQAKKYREEIVYLNKNWKKLGYTEQEYVEKLEELKEGQYDAIKAYNDTKDAIVDLNRERVDAIKDGIQKEIDAYEELISKKKEELDSEKDLYDFQKGVADQQKDIADIERKLAALSADNSATARAERARLQAELAEAQQQLEETYYDRSVTKQQEALDKELENFQDAKNEEMEQWDEYLENTEQVVSDSLATIQANTDIVYQTLQSMGQEYSLSITDALTSPWIDGESAIQSYSEKFGLTMSSTVDELRKVADEYKEIMDEIEGYGDQIVNRVNENVNTYQGTNPQPEEQKITPETPAKTIKVGSQINAGSAKIYGYAGDKSGEKQYYSNDPIYKVLSIQGDWLLVRHHKLSSGTTGWFKKGDVKAYAQGTTGVNKDQLAWIDEMGLEELVMHAGPNGRLQYLTKGTSVIPSDISDNLMEWGALDPQNMLDQNRPVISSPHTTNNNIQLTLDVGEVVHIDTVTNDTIPDLTKTINKELDKYMTKLNQQIRKFTR